MNFLKPAIMASAVALVATTSCNSSKQQSSAQWNGPVAQAKVEKGEFTPEILNSFGRVNEWKVSPDGKKVLFAVSFIDLKKNKSNAELWVMDIDGKNPVKLTDSPNSESNPVWIDGGKKIAFVYQDEKEDAVPQMWVMDADGDDRKCVSSMEKGVEGFIISPDEKKVVLVSTVQYGKTVQDIYPDMEKSDARIIDDMMYRHWNEWTAEIPQPFVGDFNGSKVENIKNVLDGTQFESPMRPWGGVEQLAWTPDSKQLIYTCRKKTGREYAVSTNSDLYLYDVASGKTLQNLTEGMMGYDTNPIVSKSGKVAWLSMEHDGFEADKNRIFLMDKVGGEKKDLTAKWDYTVDAITWSPDEKYIYFTCPFQGTIPLFRINVETQQIDTIATGQCDYSGVGFAENGTITVNGEQIYNGETDNKIKEKDLRQKRLHFGLVFQDFNLFPQYNVLQNLTLAPSLLKMGTKEELEAQARQIIKKVGLEEKVDFYPCQLSGGQKQRVAIARALMLNPDILCFDEPTSALDPELTGEVLRVIKSLKDTGSTMIVVTHEMEFARNVSDKVMFMADGVVEEMGDPAQIFDNPQSEKTRAFLANSLEKL